MSDRRLEALEEMRERQAKTVERKARLSRFEDILNRTLPYEQVVNDPHWNVYANDLKEWIDGALVVANDLAGQLTHADKILTTDQVTAIRLKVVEQRAKADAWAQALAKPMQMVADREQLEDDLRKEPTAQHA